MAKKKEVEKRGDYTFCCRGFLGIAFIVFGVIWLLGDIGLISLRVSLWPFILLCVGASMLYHKFKYYCCPH